MDSGITTSYRPRIIDDQIEHMLSKIGAIHLKGPKWCGKTTTAERHSKSALRLQNPLDPRNYEEIAKINLKLLLEGETPRLIDEWQTIPEIWNGVRAMVDLRKVYGQYILTGSSSPIYMPAEKNHSGAGRIATLNMRTMSLFESGDSSGAVSMRSLFDPDTVLESESRLEIEDIARLIVRGGWPSSIVNNIEDGETVGWYCDAILNSEITIDGKRRNREKMERLLRSLSRNISTGANNTTILRDMTGDDELPIGDASDEDAWIDENTARAPMNRDTLRDYISILKSICLIEDSPAWMPKLRSETCIRTSDTRYLTDPSIGAYFLGTSADDLLYDPETMGLLFENMVVRDLRVYAESIGGTVKHYRDKSGLEVDSIVHLNNGQWGAIEIKLSSRNAKSGVKNLLRLKERVDAEERNKLSFLAVITGDGYAYTDVSNGQRIHMIPIGCLRN
ncbi:ATP-binding protein [Candidatus Methanoprimaticola sp. MG2]|uniref:ATP-binding protein n=1 Tax=Candidatus Methanoprimaticola sp. MG2 TaxID=3228838 RepID=UPI0039C7396A